MTKIILGILAQVFGGVLVFSSFQARAMPLPIFLGLLSIAVLFGGIALTLSGIREYMLGEITELLKSLNGKPQGQPKE